MFSFAWIFLFFIIKKYYLCIVYAMIFFFFFFFGSNPSAVVSWAQRSSKLTSGAFTFLLIPVLVNKMPLQWVSWCILWWLLF